MSQFQLHPSESADRARKNSPLEQLFPPGETTAQGDPAARTNKHRRIIVIPPKRLRDMDLVHYLLKKQKQEYLVQTHIVSEHGRVVLGVRAYPKSFKSPAHVGFIVLEATGEFKGKFERKEKTLQAQVYDLWNTPPEFKEVTEKLRKLILWACSLRRLRASSRRKEYISGERLSVALMFARKRSRDEFHTANTTAA